MGLSEPLPNEPRYARSDLRASLGDGAVYSVMVGAGETYLGAFVLALGMGQVKAGLIATVPLLAGAVLQTVAPLGVRRLGSYRRWVVACALVQAAAFIPLVLVALAGQASPLTVFLLAALYWGAGMATGPAWNTWIGTLVPVRLRARFFSLRTRLSHVGVLIGFLLGGLTLQWGAANGHLLKAFAALFAIAGTCRFISAALLARQREPVPPNGNQRRVSVPEFLSRLSRSSEGRLLRFALAVQVAVQISGPFFTPYMLKQLHFSYSSYVGLLAISFAAKIIALPLLGRWAHRWGPQKLLTVAAASIVPLAASWAISDSWTWLVLTQMVSGAAWAAYELSLFLLFLETIHEEERTSLLTTFNVANALAIVAGSLVGGALLRYLGETKSVYLVLFALSSTCRLMALGLLLQLPRMVVRPATLELRTVTVRPMGEVDGRPVLASLREQPPEEMPAEPETQTVRLSVSTASLALDQPMLAHPPRDEHPADAAA